MWVVFDILIENSFLSFGNLGVYIHLIYDTFGMLLIFSYMLKYKASSFAIAKYIKK